MTEEERHFEMHPTNGLIIVVLKIADESAKHISWFFKYSKACWGNNLQRKSVELGNKG